MGILREIKNSYRMAEAAAVVKNLLEIQRAAGVFEGSPVSSASKMVRAVWKDSPHLFDGRFDMRPHKISIAAAALANAVDSKGHADDGFFAAILSLGNVILEVSRNGRLYPFQDIDKNLLGFSVRVLDRVNQEMGASDFGREVEAIVAGKRTMGINGACLQGSSRQGQCRAETQR